MTPETRCSPTYLPNTKWFLIWLLIPNVHQRNCPTLNSPCSYSQYQIVPKELATKMIANVGLIKHLRTTFDRTFKNNWLSRVVFTHWGQNCMIYTTTNKHLTDWFCLIAWFLFEIMIYFTHINIRQPPTNNPTTQWPFYHVLVPCIMRVSLGSYPQYRR